jgi:HTH-type transcriptional regulator/antitoxin HigA
VAIGRKTECTTRRATPPPASYLRLIRRFPLRPIESEAELDAAIAMVDELLDRDDLAAGERDYLDVLGELLERYEEKAHAIPDVSEGKMLAFLIEQKHTTQAEVARGTGIAESTISSIISGKRRLTRRQLELLARWFQVSPGVFLGER